MDNIILTIQILVAVIIGAVVIIFTKGWMFGVIAFILIMQINIPHGRAKL